jgi:hypothetical protein
MNDYELGMSDCQSGIPARENASDDYIEGYGCINECATIFNLETFDESWASL